MADKKISELTELATQPADDDLVALVDTSATATKYSQYSVFIPDASTTVKGKIEIATTAETTTGTDAVKAVSPDGLKDGYQGSTNVTTLGTIATGTWEGTDVGVEHGGTGLSTITDHSVIVGSATGAITPITVGTNGQVLVGSTGADPVFATITDGEGIDTTLGAGTLQIDCEDATTSNKGVGSFNANDFAVSSGAVSVSTNISTPDLTGNTYTIAAGDRTVLIDDDDAQVSATVVVTLPAAASSADRIITIKKIGATYTVQIDGNGSETIDESTTQDIVVQYDSITVHCDSTKWWII